MLVYANFYYMSITFLNLILFIAKYINFILTHIFERSQYYPPNIFEKNGEFYMRIKWKSLLINIIICLGVGALAWLLTRNNLDVYQIIEKPFLAPPSWVFPVVWTILYTLMGVGSYLIDESESEYKANAIRAFWIQLFFNFIWSPIFFNLNAFGIAFIVLVLLWFSILYMIFTFSKVSKLAAVLQIPYLLWVTFAGYLNLQIYLMNTHL